jgi:hypothetical protein
MFAPILRIARDLFVDGYSVVGAIAPLLSIGFTAAKALDLAINLRGISYAWALLPLLLWVVVAYVRRNVRFLDLERQQNNPEARADGLTKLGELRARGVALRNKSVNSKQEMDRWFKDEADWLEEVYKAAGEVSRPLRDRVTTLDTVSPGPRVDTPGFTPEHTHFRNIISEVTKRIGEFLEKNQ